MGDCCLNVSGIGLSRRGVVYEVNCVLNGEFPSYSFDVIIGDLFSVFYISYNEETSLWSLGDGVENFDSTTFSGNLTCPDGLQFTYNVVDRFSNTTYTYTVYQVPCDLTPTPPIIEYAPECLQEACRNKNLFNKQKRVLAEDIAGISKKEIFGFKCGDAWENIFMRNLIIHALSCMPTGVLSVEKEKCLIGKLTDKCNC